MKNFIHTLLAISIFARLSVGLFAEDETTKTDAPKQQVIKIFDKDIEVILPNAVEGNLEITPNKKFHYAFTESKSFDITQALENFLDELAMKLKENPNWIVYIDGNADNQAGTTQEKYDISVLRAENAKKYLVELGVKPNRIFPRGRSDLYPLMPNDTEKGRQASRRVEIRISAK